MVAGCSVPPQSPSLRSKKILITAAHVLHLGAGALISLPGQWSTSVAGESGGHRRGTKTAAPAGAQSRYRSFPFPRCEEGGEDGDQRLGLQARAQSFSSSRSHPGSRMKFAEESLRSPTMRLAAQTWMNMSGRRRKVTVCVPAEKVAGKSVADDGVGRGAGMEVAFAMAARSRCGTSPSYPFHVCSNARDPFRQEPGLSGCIFCGWAFSKLPNYSVISSWMLTPSSFLVCRPPSWQFLSAIQTQLNLRRMWCWQLMVIHAVGLHAIYAHDKIDMRELHISVCFFSARAHCYFFPLEHIQIHL